MQAQSNQQRSKQQNRRRASVRACQCAVLAVGLAAVSAAQASGGDALETNRAALEKYVETRRIISDEKRKLALGRQMLTDQIEVVKSQVEALRTKITEAQASITDADAKKAGLVEENRKLIEATAGLASTVAALEARTKALLPRLPEPVAQKVRLFSQRIPEKPDATGLSLGERFQNVIGVLNEINKCNREITIGTPVLTLADGTQPEVTALYVGIGLAYYVNAGKTIAGIGTATADGWTWTPANDIAERVAQTIAILKNEKEADFVGLPVQIR